MTALDDFRRHVEGCWKCREAQAVAPYYGQSPAAENCPEGARLLALAIKESMSARRT